MGINSDLISYSIFINYEVLQKPGYATREPQKLLGFYKRPNVPVIPV
jgi:hypothetical protein